MRIEKSDILMGACVVALLLFCCSTSKAQSRSGFPKSGRGVASSVANPQRTLTPAQNQRQQQYRQQQYRNRRPQFNHHSFYSSRSVTGNGFRYSPGHVRGTIVPVVPFGYVDPYAYGYGYSPVYQDPYAFGPGFNRFGFQNVNPAYSTYGSYLNTGGVLNSNVVGSSVAAQALERLRNQQAVIPNQPNANAGQEAEILRLQIELERAKQQLAAQNQPQQQQLLKPPIEAPNADANQAAIDQLGLAPIIETNQIAAASHLKAERAFRDGDYGQAARFAGLAHSLDETNGKLLLFASQAHFANGEYREAAASLVKAQSLVEPEELGFVVQNFKLFYGKNDFVSQMQSLSSHLNSSPNDARAFLLRGFQYGALGYPDAASKDLQKAKRLGANVSLANLLIQTFASGDVE